MGKIVNEAAKKEGRTVSSTRNRTDDVPTLSKAKIWIMTISSTVILIGVLFLVLDAVLGDIGTIWDNLSVSRFEWSGVCDDSLVGDFLGKLMGKDCKD